MRGRPAGTDGPDPPVLMCLVPHSHPAEEDNDHGVCLGSVCCPEYQRSQIPQTILIFYCFVVT